MFWGLSEAIDLVDEYFSSLPLETGNAAAPPVVVELNVLLYGCGDPRHIITTMARSQINTKGHHRPDGSVLKVHFYVLEGCVELLARHMLLLNIALEPSAELSVKAKTHLFMDIYGNSLLRPSSYNYMCSKARVFMDLISDLDGECTEKWPMVKLNDLKYSERDTLLDVFSFWQHKPKHTFEIAQYWEQRVRSYLESRYDSRSGAFDWDLSMRLREHGVARICAQEYKHWRDTGVAFVFPEYEQTLPNKTLAAGLVRSGQGFRHRGYLGDITTGPFVTFGEKCADPAMCKSSHGVNTYRSTDLTERNVFQLLFEIQERRPYASDANASRQFGATSLLLSKHMAATPSVLDDPADELHRFNRPAIAVDNVTVHFLSIEDVLSASTRQRFVDFFDVAFVAHNYFAFLNANFRNVLRDRALVCFETKQNQVLLKEPIAEFLRKIKEFAARIELKAITKFNINTPLPIVRYRHGTNGNFFK